MNISLDRAGSGPVFQRLRKRWYIIVLALIAFLSFLLNFYGVSEFGYGNAYYAAAIKSMTQSFKNFFFVSFDPAGIVMVDKPPLALWIQAIFVLVFGYQGWAMLLPQALAGTGSSIMMYILTAKRFGRPAGLLSALFFALTPAVVVASRNNTMDMQLVFALLVATFYFFRALETSKWRYLFMASFFVGIGFNIKMLQAFMILPAMVIVYLIFAKEKFVKRIISGLFAVLILAAVSFSWVLAVDLYPAEKRPYVGSSSDNTEMELIIGHNGLKRIYQGLIRPRVGTMSGSTFGGGARPQTGSGSFGNRSASGGTRQSSNQEQMNAGAANEAPQQYGRQYSNRQTQNNLPPQSGQQSFPGLPGQGVFGGRSIVRGGGGNNIGTAGVFRLWSRDLYGQASWLIVFAVFCIFIRIRKFSFKTLTSEQGIYSYWVIWLAVMYLFFSFAGFYHRYYLCMFAPAVAALSGIGFAEIYKCFREKESWSKCVLPSSLVSTSLINIIYIFQYDGLKAWLVPLTAVFAAASLIFMSLHLFKSKRFALPLSAAFMIISILAAPIYWCYTAAKYPPQNSTMPYAGPELSSASEIPGMTANQEIFIKSDANTLALEKYLVENYKEGTFLVVSQSSADVAAFIIDTGLPAVAYGGFLGTDSALKLEQIKELVKAGKITYFLISMKSMGNSSISTYVKSTATLIYPYEYGASSDSGYSLYRFS